MSATIYNSEHIGVHWDNNRCKWYAKIHISGTSLFLGRFKDEDAAISAREKAETVISLLRNMDAVNIHVSSVVYGNRTISGILSENGFRFKFEIDLSRTSADSVGDDL